MPDIQTNSPDTNFGGGGGASAIGDLSDWPAGVSVTELGYIGGLTSDAQTQINAKAAASHTHAASDIASGTIATARLGSGTANSASFLRGDQTWAAPSATVTAKLCVLQKSVFQTVSAATWTDITFDQELFDTDSWHSTSSNTARVTVDAAGKYLVISPWMLRPTSANAVLFALAKNGTRLTDAEQYHNVQSSGVINGGTFAYIVDLAANDYITQQIYCAAEIYVYGDDSRGDNSSHRLIVIRLGD